MPGSVHVGSVVDKVALGQGILRVLQFSLVNIIIPWLSIQISLGVNNRPIGGCSSEESYPIDMNIIAEMTSAQLHFSET
jgi:hypothetical protein